MRLDEEEVEEGESQLIDAFELAATSLPSRLETEQGSRQILQLKR